MNHWPFVIASYAIVLIATAAVIVSSYATMRKAESKADQLGKRR